MHLTSRSARTQLMIGGTLVAMALAGATAAHGAADTKDLKGPGFRTVYPADWGITKKSSKGASTYSLASPGATLDNVGIAGAGAAGVTVESVSVKSLETATHHKLPKGNVALAESVVGHPAASSHVKFTSKPHGTKLGGSGAGALSVTYTYKGRQILQRDVVSRHAGRVFFVELDVDTTNAQQLGQPALRTVLQGWHWR